jgi:hypothetical protein
MGNEALFYLSHADKERVDLPYIFSNTRVSTCHYFSQRINGTQFIGTVSTLLEINQP